MNVETHDARFSNNLLKMGDLIELSLALLILLVVMISGRMISLQRNQHQCTVDGSLWQPCFPVAFATVAVCKSKYSATVRVTEVSAATVCAIVESIQTVPLICLGVMIWQALQLKFFLALERLTDPDMLDLHKLAFVRAPSELAFWTIPRTIMSAL